MWKLWSRRFFKAEDLGIYVLCEFPNHAVIKIMWPITLWSIELRKQLIFMLKVIQIIFNLLTAARVWMFTSPILNVKRNRAAKKANSPMFWLCYHIANYNTHVHQVWILPYILLSVWQNRRPNFPMKMPS